MVQSDRPNIVFVFCDDLGWGDVSCLNPDSRIRTPNVDRLAAEGMLFRDASGKAFRGYGMFAVVSFDEGGTWPVRKLITDGRMRHLEGGAWTGGFLMDATHTEPKGYLAATQTPDRVIHLISSKMHYRFNLTWLYGER